MTLRRTINGTPSPAPRVFRVTDNSWIWELKEVLKGAETCMVMYHTGHTSSSISMKGPKDTVKKIFNDVIGSLFKITKIRTEEADGTLIYILNVDATDPDFEEQLDDLWIKFIHKGWIGSESVGYAGIQWLLTYHGYDENAEVNSFYNRNDSELYFM